MEHRMGIAGALGNLGLGLAGRFTNADFRPRNTFTNAGWNAFGELPKGEGRDGWVGWLGVGGSVLQWFEGGQYRIGFGFCGTNMHLIPTNERALSLQNAVQTCCAALFHQNRGRSKM